MDLIADTNVWYDISQGIRNPARLKEGGDRLIATPISLLEIASLISKQSFSERKEAAKAVIAYADEIAVDNEYHLATLWGLQVNRPNVPWLEGYQAIAMANTLQELQDGINDFVNQRIIKVNLPLANVWRGYHWNDFYDKVVDAIDQRVPGYKKKLRRGKSPHYLNKEKGHILANELRSLESGIVFTLATFVRALKVANQPPRIPSEKEVFIAEPLVAPYVAAYIEYLISCATKISPEPNDLGDSEIFYYLQGNNRFLSSDRRWVNISRIACPKYCFDPENKVVS